MKKRPNHPSEADQRKDISLNRLEQDFYDALKDNYFFFPTTEEEVEALETKRANEDISVNSSPMPASLADPESILSIIQGNSSEEEKVPAKVIRIATEEAEQARHSLAMVAREGKNIPDAIKQKMAKEMKIAIESKKNRSDDKS